MPGKAPRTIAGMLAVGVVALTANGVHAQARAEPGPADRRLATEQRYAIIVPGWNAGQGGLEQLQAALEAGGMRVRYPDVGLMHQDFFTSALAVRSLAGELRRDGATSIDLIGMSAGGLTVRAAIALDQGPSTYRRAVTIGTPHQGTDLTQHGGYFETGCDPLGSCGQMKPGSDFLRLLPGPPRRGTAILSLWSASDGLIVPAASSVLPGARNIELTSTCPAEGSIDHSQLGSSPAVLAIAVQYLNAASPRSPLACP